MTELRDYILSKLREMGEPTPPASQPSKKTAKPKKAKVKAEAVIETGSTFDDGEPLNIDFGTIENNSKENE